MDFGNIAGIVKHFDPPQQANGDPKTWVLWAKETVALGDEVTIMRYDFINLAWVAVASEKQVYKVDAATNVAQLYTGVTEIDGLTLVNGNRVLLVGQVDAKENGVYVSDGAGVLTRAADYAVTIPGNHLILVHYGQSGKYRQYTPLNTSNVESFTIGVDSLNYTIFNDPVSLLNSVTKAASADGVITNVALVGTELQFTGANGGFNGNVDVGALLSGAAKYVLDFVVGDFTAEQIDIDAVDHERGLYPMIQVIDTDLEEVVLVEKLDVNIATGDIKLIVGVGEEFNGTIIVM